MKHKKKAHHKKPRETLHRQSMTSYMEGAQDQIPGANASERRQAAQRKKGYR